MARSTKEKLLGAELTAELVDKFRMQTGQRGFKKKRALQGAIKLWLSLPNELKVFIISRDCGEDVFAELLKYIIKTDKGIDKLRDELREILRPRDQPES